MASLENRLHNLRISHVARVTPPNDPDRTYMNVSRQSRPSSLARSRLQGQTPVATAPGPKSTPKTGPTPPKLPVIPQSQDVKKFMKEPSYSTILQPHNSILSTPSNATNRSNLSNAQLSRHQVNREQPIYVNYELPSSDSQGSMDDDPYGGRLSPVSSSYSELRQATKLPPGYHLQQMHHLESFYEPVHPPSEQGATRFPQGRSNSSQQDPNKPWLDLSEYFGQCSVCDGKILGEGSGCSAMSKLYHIECFVCSQCRCNLQGKPFYALDGKPLCHADYLEHCLEKCCKCQKPIQDRILRATVVTNSFDK